MSIFSWIILGVIVGLVTSKLLNSARDGIILDIIWSVAGALVGGAIANLSMPGSDITAFTVESVFVALIGAILVLTIKHTFENRQRTQR